MANESKSKQAGSSGQTQQGQERQQQAEQRNQGQQGGGYATSDGQGGSDESRQASGQRQEMQVAQKGQRGAVQHRDRRDLARYSSDPFSVMQQLSNEMDDLFDAFFYGRPLARRGRQSELQNLWAPEVEVKEENNQLRISVDLPGIPKDSVKIEIQDGAVTLQGERHEERKEGDQQHGFHRTERRYGTFYRSIPLPEGADADHAQANMKDGVLEITVPFAGRKQGKRLEIKG